MNTSDNTGTAGFTSRNRPESGYLFEGLRLCFEGKLFRGKTPINLTDTEARVLRQLVMHAGQVVSHALLRQIATDAGDSDDISQVISSLEERLGVADCIEAVYRRGYRFRCEVKTYSLVPNGAGLRIAILPFLPGVGVPSYLAEALTEETGQQLKTTSAGAVQVLEQDSVATLAGRKMSLAQIGSTLQADLVLVGALRALPGRFRLKVEMVRGTDGGSLWGEDIIVPVERVHSIAGELAQRIGQRIGHGISINASEDADEVYPAEAHELMWRAHSEWKTLQRHQMQDALQRLQRAVELAPQWTRVRVELVNLCVYQAVYGFMAPQVAANTIRHAAEAATDRGSEALSAALGWIQFHVDHDLGKALQALERAAHLPHERGITLVRLMFSLSRHRFSEAISIAENSVRLDPHSGGLRARLAWASHLAGDAAQSVKQIDYALQEFPDRQLTKLYAVPILAYNGQAERAAAIAEELMRHCPYLDPAISAYAYALACAGRRDESQGLLEQLEWLSRERFVLRAFSPAVYVALEDLDSAMNELRVCERVRCPWFFQTLADPRLAPLRQRKDFQELALILPRLEAEAAERLDFRETL